MKKRRKKRLTHLIHLPGVIRATWPLMAACQAGGEEAGRIEAMPEGTSARKKQRAEEAERAEKGENRRRGPMGTAGGSGKVADFRALRALKANSNGVAHATHIHITLGWPPTRKSTQKGSPDKGPERRRERRLNDVITEKGVKIIQIKVRVRGAKIDDE